MALTPLACFFPPTLLTTSLTCLGMHTLTNGSFAGFQPTLANFVPQEQRGLSVDLKGLFILLGSARGVGERIMLSAANLPALASLLLLLILTLTTLLKVLAMAPYDQRRRSPVPGRNRTCHCHLGPAEPGSRLICTVGAGAAQHHPVRHVHCGPDRLVLPLCAWLCSAPRWTQPPMA